MQNLLQIINTASSSVFLFDPHHCNIFSFKAMYSNILFHFFHFGNCCLYYFTEEKSPYRLNDLFYSYHFLHFLLFLFIFKVDWATPGHEAGMQAAESFGQHRLAKFDDLRNNPNENACSNLSPYFHFGQISVAAVILMFKEKFSKKAAKGVQTFLEEAVVRREVRQLFGSTILSWVNRYHYF